KQLIPIAKQSQYLSLVKKACNELEDLCNGIFLLGELTARSKDRIASYGEWLSSQIIAAKMAQDELDVVWKDSRELIVTDDQFTAAQVDYVLTDENVINYFKNASQQVTILPGFIAASKQGVTTTLGRGGS